MIKIKRNKVQIGKLYYFDGLLDDRFIVIAVKRDDSMVYYSYLDSIHLPHLCRNVRMADEYWIEVGSERQKV